MCIRDSGVKDGGRPDLFASPNDAVPGCTHQRWRHLRTVSTHTPTRWAILVLVHPAAASNTILARATNCCAVVPARIRCSNRCCWERLISIRSGLVIDMAGILRVGSLISPVSLTGHTPLVAADTPISDDDPHGSPTGIDQDVPATAPLRRRPRLRRRPLSQRPHALTNPRRTY